MSSELEQKKEGKWMRRTWDTVRFRVGLVFVLVAIAVFAIVLIASALVLALGSVVSFVIAVPAFVFFPKSWLREQLKEVSQDSTNNNDE